MDWTAFSAVATAAAAGFAAYAARQSRNQVKAANEASQISAAQIQVFENIFRDILQQEERFYSGEPASPEEKGQRDRMFFNTINYLAFLIDSKILRKTELLDYYKDAFLYWWTLFEREVPEVDRKNPKCYPEFKRIVSDFRRETPKFQSIL